MATKLANHMGPNPHTSGIFADMTVDGPEIGTLVLVVDRAKNLPNRKTMGKQNPYCAARLGKEAQKTETDRRGGQTPKWDQELRFTVHDSPDYNQIKISVFSEDKRTDLIGEAWADLTKIVVPGGGKDDLWQGLNCKGKYAGELRIELTYYDSRPKPENVPESVVGTEDLRQSLGSAAARVKRRPLPNNPNSGHVTPDMIGQPAPPGRAKHGPRDFRTPARANSMPPESLPYSQPHPGYGQPLQEYEHPNSSSMAEPMDRTPPNQYYGEYYQPIEPQEYLENVYDPQDDLLPQLPPSNRPRGSLPPQPRYGTRQVQPVPQARPQSHIGLPHSYSAPVVPHSQPQSQNYDDGYQLRTDYPEPIPDLEYQHQQVGARQRRYDIPPGWQSEYGDSYASMQPYVEDEEAPAPPPPPMHSNSAPVVPQFASPRGHSYSSPASAYGITPPSARNHSVPNSSPLQNIERRYDQPQRTPVSGHAARGRSVDDYTPLSERSSYDSSPSGYIPGQTPSPYSSHQPTARPLPPQSRHSVADPYYTTPSRPHPLSQEVPRPRSPQPYLPQGPPGSSPLPNDHSPYQQDYRGRDAPPLIKPRALSPRPRPPRSAQSESAARPKSSYSIQHPIRAFESSDNSPLSTSQPNARLPQPSSAGSTPLRKSISSHPAPLNTTALSPSTPFSPESFDVHNPHAQRSVLDNQVSPHSPYQVRPGSDAVPRDGQNGPIVGWHGQEIDPSDHLPVDSWAPEPERKTPVKTYGLGRDRDFGPRSAHNSAGRNLSKDTVINVRMKSAPPIQQQAPPPPPPEPEQPSPTRNRLQKKSGPGRSPALEALREHHNYNSVSVPDPYEQQQEYSRGFYQSSERSYIPGNIEQADALTREISSIDIGGSRYGGGGRSPGGVPVPAPTAYVPVRSHKDRRSFY